MTTDGAGDAAQDPSGTYRSATHTEPDFLVIQVPAVPAVRALLTRRGFTAVVEGDDLGLRAANGCLLTCTGPTSAELLVTIGEQVGASRFPVPDLDPAWWARTVELGHAAVLVVRDAVGPDGTVTREDLRREIDAGGVVAALVPAADQV